MATEPYALKRRMQCRGTLALALAPVTARKDDAPAADQAAITNVLAVTALSSGGGLIQTTSG